MSALVPDLKHHRTGAPPIMFTSELMREEPVMCPECLLPVYVALNANEWACVDPACRYA